MDGRVIISLIFLAVMIVVVIMGIQENIKQKQKILKYLDKTFGKENKGDASAYVKDFTDSNWIIDDITAGDLDLEKVFSKIDHTKSLTGCKYLYNMIRKQSFDDTEFDKLENYISYFEKNPEVRRNIQYYLFLLGKGSSYDYVSYLSDKKQYSVISHLFLYILYIASAALMFVKPGLGILLLIGSLAYAIITYFKFKTSFSPFFNSAFYILKLIKTAENIRNSLKADESKVVSDILQQLNTKIKLLKKMMAGSWYVFLSADSNKNILSMITDYINMIFHIDIIMFIGIDKKLKAIKDDIIGLADIIGYTDSVISILSYRGSLPSYAVPGIDVDEHKANNHSQHLISNVYHPLVKNAVTNDFSVNENMLITGSNASGKSTYLKASALAIVMAQSIHTVCGTEYNMPYLRVYTSMALKDNVISGQSFFLAEINSIKRIIDSSKTGKDVPVICFIDEILKGTNTIERIAASSVIAKYFQDSNIKAVFATHDIELTEILKNDVRNVHFEEGIGEKDVTFTYKLIEGPATSKNAIRLLKLLEYDDIITVNAAKVADNFEKNREWKLIYE